MGSYGGQNSSGNGAPRRKIITLTASNPSISIPRWARGGIMEVWGTAGGANSGAESSKGETGAIATGFKIVLPATASVLSATIGAGAPISTSGGIRGGDTAISIDGVEYLRLEGGSSTLVSKDGSDVKFAGKSMAIKAGGTESSPVLDNVRAVIDTLIKASAITSRVAPSYALNTSKTVGFDDGGSVSLFGANGIGYGFGGNRNQKAGDGFLSIEFIEGAVQ